MLFDDFEEQADIQYICYVLVNGETAGEISAPTQDSLIEEFNKLDTSIKNEVQKQYEELPENQDLNEDFSGAESEGDR